MSRFPSLGMAVVAMAAACVAARAEEGLPRPGIGVFFKAEDVPRLREKIRRAPCLVIYEQLLKRADEALAKWPAERAEKRLAELAPKLADIQTEFVPTEFLPEGGKEAGVALGRYATQGAPAAAFAYLMTGERKYADFAWDVFELCAKANRWGWFPWAGSHMPQIHFGIQSRNLVLVADCVWDTLTPAQRQHAREAIAEQCVEPYYRIVLHTPGMGLFHLRSRNQGNNALAAALCGSLFVGDAVPDNAIWFRSLLQTYHWAITHDIGWMGQGLESGVGGYWTVSMQNLYTAAAALANVRGIDLRPHPGFDQATYYPIIHEATVPPVGMFDQPINPVAQPPSAVPAQRGAAVPHAIAGIIASKPIELPGSGRGGAWWLDYAVHFPASPAHYFISREMVRAGGGRGSVRPAVPTPERRDEQECRLQVSDGHQAALSDVLAIAWWDDRLLEPPKPPRSLAQFTDRMAGIRSGYGFSRIGQTYLYFNGDLFLSARNEILNVTSGMAWHFPWHQYQISESGVETEGELFAPSMILKESYNDDHFAYFRAEAGFSNVAYYPQPGQRECHEHYAKRERSVLYVRASDGAPDYFLFVDRVALKNPEPRWHAWTWHLWNSVSGKNPGRFVPQSETEVRTDVRAERPNADLWIKFIGRSRLDPVELAFEQHGIPSQPHVSYQMDHNGLMLRAIAGGYKPTNAKPVSIPPSAWKGLGTVEAGPLPRVSDPREVKKEETPAVGEFLHLNPPPTEKTVTSDAVTGLVGGTRYRLSLQSKKQDYRAYEATAWEVSLELLDKDGQVIAKPTTPYGHPHPLRLGCPRSDQLTHDWVETVQYFDAPANAVGCRASFRAVGGAHYFKLGELWLGPVELTPVGVPERSQEQWFIALVMPLGKGEKAPMLIGGETDIWHLSFPGGVEDRIVPSWDGPFKVTRTANRRVVGSFASNEKRPGATDALKTNSDDNAKQLLAGLKPVLDDLAAQRDAITGKGRKNLALDAKVTASATRDERFAPAHVIDNQVAEYPTDGHLDYTLGIVWTSSRFAGYGSGKESLLDNRDYFPLYVRPTYWLLPEMTLGHIELDLKEPAAVRLVRLLNTSNAGLNDFAAHTFRVELYDSDRKLLASKDGAFGKVFDRPFQHAFFAPKWFDHYMPSFAGMLEPGLTVPFGDGCHEVPFEGIRAARYVRVVLTKFWGIGGGLNEIQVFP